MEKEGAKNHPPLWTLKGIVVADPLSDHETRAVDGKGGEETTIHRSIKTNKKNKQIGTTSTGKNPVTRFFDSRLALFLPMIPVSENFPRECPVPEEKIHIR